MGSWFSNIHIRVNETAGPDAVEAYLRQLLTQQGYLCAASSEEADGAAAVIGGAHWITVCSDLLELEGPDAVAALGGPLSEHLQTDVLGIGCFDSDYLYLNLIDHREKVNAWLGIGSGPGHQAPDRAGGLEKEGPGFRSLLRLRQGGICLRRGIPLCGGGLPGP